MGESNCEDMICENEPVFEKRIPDLYGLEVIQTEPEVVEKMISLKILVSDMPHLREDSDTRNKTGRIAVPIPVVMSSGKRVKVDTIYRLENVRTGEKYKVLGAGYAIRVVHEVAARKRGPTRMDKFVSWILNIFYPL